MVCKPPSRQRHLLFTDYTDNEMKKLLILSILPLLLLGCTSTVNEMAYVEDGKFYVDGEPYRFIGVNFWYGAILGSQGEGGNRERLAKELDMLKSIGVTNVRVLVGSDGAPDTLSTSFSSDMNSGVANVRSHKVQPTLQTAPGVYNDDILDGLDWMMVELAKRDMTAVLYMNNTWEWSGGYGQYLAWAHSDETPDELQNRNGLLVSPWESRTNMFYKDSVATAMFEDHIKFIVSRTNRYTGVKYIDDPTLFSWQIGNEPRPLGRDNKEVFIEWIDKTAKLIRSLDPNHMISTGNEGEMGSDNDMEIVDAINAIPEISYMTIHIWPFNWSWIRENTIQTNLPVAIENTGKYIEKHIGIASKYSKPIAIEEFGYPRDNYAFKLGTPVTARNEYYEYLFKILVEQKEQDGPVAGCNLWTWGGFAIPADDHDFWYKGDDYTGDPAQENQGLNSVFVSDTVTIELIEKYNKLLNTK